MQTILFIVYTGTPSGVKKNESFCTVWTKVRRTGWDGYPEAVTLCFKETVHVMDMKEWLMPSGCQSLTVKRDDRTGHTLSLCLSGVSAGLHTHSLHYLHPSLAQGPISSVLL